jgi:hypothetical protein
MLPRIGTAWGSSISSAQAAPRSAGGGPNQSPSAAKPAYSRYAQPVPSRTHAGSDSEADSFAETESDEFSSDSERRSKSAPLIRVGKAQASSKHLPATAGPRNEHEDTIRAHLHSAQNNNPVGPRQVVLRPLGQDTQQQQQQQQHQQHGSGQRRADAPGPAQRGRPAAPAVEVYDMSKRAAGPGGGGAADISDSESDDGDGGDAASRSSLQRSRAAAAAGRAGGGESQEVRTKYGVTVQVDRMADMDKYADFDRCSLSLYI